MKFTPSEIELRRPIWLALSDLFLDTDVSVSYEYIARVCSESEFSMLELKGILENEVAPAVSINLLSVAGEWAGFNEEWLVKRICQKAEKELIIPNIIQKMLKSFRFKSHTEEHWGKILPKIKRIRMKT